MEEKFIKWNNILLLPGAFIALIAGIVSIYKDTEWYIYIPLFLVTTGLIALSLLLKTNPHEFETLWQSLTLVFLDNTGKEALFTNATRLKASKDGAQNFDYILYCDGNIEDILTEQGAVAEIKKEGGRFIVKTQTECPIRKGEEIEHKLTAKYVDGFTSEKEYFQTAKNIPGTGLKMTILSPLMRPMKEFKSFKIIGHTKILMAQQPKRITTGVVQGIELDFRQAKFLEKYRIEWTW